MPAYPYQVYLHRCVAEGTQSLRGSQKRAVLDFLDQLQADPFIQGDFKKYLGTRDLEVKVIGRHAVYFYADHAVKEVKIVELLRSDLA